LDREGSGRPERRTALVAQELQRYRIDIAALSETRLADTGEITEVGSGYTFFWSGKPQEEHREAGVGFAVRTSLVKSLESLPRGINDRLMGMRIPLKGKQQLTLISAYAPTMSYTQEEKEQFYESLSEMIRSVPCEDKLLVLGDFNARVGKDSDAWKGVIGPHGIGQMNSNGQLLLSLCTEYDLTITNTLFQLPDIHKATWMHPRSKHWHLIDYIITRQRDVRDVQLTRAMRGADCWTDHLLLRCRLSFTIGVPPRRNKAAVRQKLNVSKLQQTCVSETLAQNITQCIERLPVENNTEKDWLNFKEAVFETAKKTLGKPERKHQDWFDNNNDEVSCLLKEKRAAFTDWLHDKTSQSKHDHLKHIRSKVQTELRRMKDMWWENKAKQLQMHADEHNIRKFYCGLRDVYGPTSNAMTPVRSAEGILLTERGDIVQRWSDHFSKLLNRPSQIDHQAIEKIPQRECLEALALPPDMQETKQAINQLQMGKAPGPDGIPPEVFKAGGEALLVKLNDLFERFWDEGQVPQDFKDANIIHLYKNKGDRASCDNHRGISLLSIAGKIMARVILNRITENLLDQVVSESQCGFRKNRGTIDMVFAIRQIQEKCREQNQSLYLLFVDLTKAFDTVSREGLWKILLKLGCPKKLVDIISSFHDGMMARVVEDGIVSDPFPVTNGVKQGCVLAPTLFSLMFAGMLFSALSATETGITIRYRCDGSVFDLRRLKAKTKVLHSLVRDFLFADDCALAAHSEADLQDLANHLSSAAKSFGLTISLKKTEVLCQPAPNTMLLEPSIFIDGAKLNNVDSFTYLGSTVTSSCSMDKEVSTRIAKASASFGRLWSRLWSVSGIKVETKLSVYRAVVITTLLYGCETWTLYRRQVKSLDQFHIRCLRKIMRISWEDRVSNTEVLQRAEMTGIQALIMKAQLRWAGHVVRMDDNRLPKMVFFSELSTGTRTVGRPLKRYKDSLKESLTACSIPCSGWETLAANRDSWRAAIHDGILQFEGKRVSDLDDKRRARKERKPDYSAAVKCPKCGRLCASDFGLRSHMRSH